MTISPIAPTAQDADLLQRFVADKDHHAFRMLVDRYHRMVFAVCYRGLNRNHAAADDATQAVFILLCRKAHRVHAAALSSWLFNTARQVTHTLRREEQRRKKRETTMVRNVDPEPTQSPAAAMLHDQRNEALHRQIARLPSKQRDAILLYYYAGLDQAQVAARLGCSPKAAQKRIEYALATLRTKLGRHSAAGSLGLTLAILDQAQKIQVPAGLAARCQTAALVPGKSLAAMHLADAVARKALLHTSLATTSVAAAIALLITLPVLYSRTPPAPPPPAAVQATPVTHTPSPAPSKPIPAPPPAPPPASPFASPIVVQKPPPPPEPPVEPEQPPVGVATGLAAMDDPPPPPRTARPVADPAPQSPASQPSRVTLPPMHAVLRLAPASSLPPAKAR